MALVAIFGAQQFCNASSQLGPTALLEQATRVLETYCISCHGPEKQKAKVRLDALETIDAVDRQKLFSDVQQVIQLGEMPPEEEKQPSESEKLILKQWLNSQLTGKAANALAE